MNLLFLDFKVNLYFPILTFVQIVLNLFSVKLTFPTGEQHTYKKLEIDSTHLLKKCFWKIHFYIEELKDLELLLEESHDCLLVPETVPLSFTIY